MKNIFLIIICFCYTKQYGVGDSLFVKKYGSFGLNFNSVIPKVSSFNYFYSADKQPQNYFPNVYLETKVSQKPTLGYGLDYSYYWRIKKHYNYNLYLATSNMLNLYIYKFNKIGQEASHGLFFDSIISEKSYNIAFEPSLNISYQKIINTKTIINYETGLGFSYQLFYYINKESNREATNHYHKESNYWFPMQLFLKAPIKVELIRKLKSKKIGIAIFSQFNDSYSILNSNLHNRHFEYNSIGREHKVGFNSIPFIYRIYSSNNYPIMSFNLNLSFSLKF